MMKTAKNVVLVLALLAGVEGAHLRRSVLAMELAAEELPAQVAAAKAPEPAAAVSLAAEPLPLQTAPAVAQSENQVWAQGVAKKTTDEALLTLFDVAAQLKSVYHSFDSDGDGEVGSGEIAALAHPVANLRRLEMELAEEALPSQVVAAAEPSPAMILAATAAPVAPAAVAAPVAAAAPAAPAASSMLSAMEHLPSAASAVPAAVPVVPAVSAATTEAKLAHLFSLVEKLVLVHGIFDADSDGVVSAGDLIKIAKGPATA